MREDLFDVGNPLLGLQVLLGLPLFLLQRFQHMVPQRLTFDVFNALVGSFLCESFYDLVIPVHGSNYQWGPLLVILGVRVRPVIDQKLHEDWLVALRGQMNHLHVLRFVNVVICHRRILVEYIFQEVPVGHVDGPANGLAEVLIRFQLGVPSLRSLFFPVLRLLIRVGDTVLWGVLAVRFGLIGFHVLELPSLGNVDVVSLGD